MKKSDIKVVLVGDDGVGKTSLVLSLISDEFPPEVCWNDYCEHSLPKRLTCLEIWMPAHFQPYTGFADERKLTRLRAQIASVVVIVHARSCCVCFHHLAIVPLA